MHIVFVFWDLPRDVLAAPESALGLDRRNTSLSLSLIPTTGVPHQISDSALDAVTFS